MEAESEYKEEDIIQVEVHDVEEGEISDSASVEEISEEDFNTKQAPASPSPSNSALKASTAVNFNSNSNGGSNGARYWTMRDSYKYQSAPRTYNSGLYNLAWAQAVNNKPLGEAFVMMEDKKTDVNDVKVVIDVEDDGEKEEGELEEGEIDFDSDVVVRNEDEFLEWRNGVDFILKEVKSLGGADFEKTFDRFCLSLKELADKLAKLLLEGSSVEKDGLVQLLITAIQNVNSVFLSMNLGVKDHNREVLLRLLTHIINLKPPLFSSAQLKEMDTILSSLDASTNHMGNDKNNTMKQLGDVVNRSDSSMYFDKDYTLVKKSKTGLEGTVSLDQSESNFSSENLKTMLINYKQKGAALPLLDLHKDHDVDSLPSPTRENSQSVPLPFEKGFPLGHVLVKPEWPVPRRTLGRGYETDAVHAVSSYQNKFGRSSLNTKDELPSPTPSGEADSGDCDMSGEVCSSTVDASSWGQPSASSVNSSIVGKSMFPCTAGVHAVAREEANKPATVGSAKLNPISRSSSLKSRDPRLRLANPNAGIAKNVSGDPRLRLANPENSGLSNARKQKTVDDLVSDGPLLKRQRNEATSSVTGSGGRLEDREIVGMLVPNGNYMKESLFDASRNLDHSVTAPRTLTSLPLTIPTTAMPLYTVAPTSFMTSQAINQPANIPFTLPLATQSSTLPMKDVNNVPSIQSLLRDIAVNPSVLMNVLMEHQKTSDLNKSMAEKPNPSVLGAPYNSLMLQKPNSVLGVPNSSMIGHVSAADTIMSHLPTISMEKSAKVQMKPRDPRRVLHKPTPPLGGFVGPDQPKLNNSLGRGNLGSLKQEVQLEKNLPISKPPDIAREFTNNLRNIADILSVSQTSSSPLLSQIPPSPNVKGHQGGLETKGAVAEPVSLRQENTLPPEEGNAGPPRPLKANAWCDVEHLFDGFDDLQKVAIQKERDRRLEEQNKMFAVRKLCLVLDLDHTLLNSAKFMEVDPVHEEMLRKKEEQDRGKPYRHLFRFPQMGMWTKLRPGIWKFLEKASKLFEMHVYTMGNKCYATEMAKLLDPKGELFSGRILSRGDDGEPGDGDDAVFKTKDLEGVLGMESAVVIMDDSVRVWPHNKLNLIAVERYIYFPCSRRQFGLPGPSLLEIDHDERPEDGTLASSLAVIERIHENFFAHESLDEADVRNILACEQRKILAGCRIVFSRVFPLEEANPHKHPLWQTAEQFGAVCTNLLNDEVTHVVANLLGTDKVNWALSRGKYVVHPGWVEASALLYRRANEHEFAINRRANEQDFAIKQP